MKNISSRITTVMIVSKHLIFGGTEKYTLNLVNALVQKGISVVLVTGDGPLVQHISTKVTTYILPISRNFRVKQYVEKRILEIAQKHKPQLIHTDSRTSMICAQKTRFELNIPLISHEHHMYNKKDYPFIISELKEGADGIITIGPYTRRMLISFGFPQDQIVAITNGVNLSDLPIINEYERNDARSSFGFNETDTIILCISRIVYGKGLDKLVMGFKQVAKRFKNAKLVIVGDDEDFNGFKSTLLKLITDLNLQKQIVIYPGDFYIRKYHAIADIFCYPALAKGMSVMEAMASGLPVVGKRTNKRPLVVEHMVSGLMTEQTKNYKIDPGELAKKLNLLLAKPQLRKDMGLEARRRVENLFSLDKHLSKLLRVYRDVLLKHEERVNAELRDLPFNSNESII
jgi:glycosyltransferase involved in cell wall biosynthesis